MHVVNICETTSLFQWMGVVFAINHDAVTHLSESLTNPDLDWLGHLDLDYKLSYWIDSSLLITLGGIPWQV